MFSGCTNRSESKKNSFYQIPVEKQDKILRKRWLHYMKRRGPLPAEKSFYICAKHFEENCFERDLKVVQKQSLKVAQAKSLKNKNFLRTFLK